MGSGSGLVARGLSGTVTANCVDPGCGHGERGEAGHGEEEVVGGVEEVDVGVAGTLGGGYKDGCPVGVVYGDVGGKACAAAGFFDDMRWGVGTE